MNEAWLVIANPIRHRQVASIYAHMRYAEEKAMAEEMGAIYINQLVDTPMPNDLWVCDFCNSSIDTLQAINITTTIHDMELAKKDADAGLPIHGGHALCGSCFQKSKNNNPEYWTRKIICGCCRTESNTTESEVLL